MIESRNTEILEISSRRTYRNFIMLYTIVLFCGFIMLAIFEKGTLLISGLLFLAFELFIFSKQFTRTVKITKTTLEITYFKWARKHFMCLDLQHVHAQSDRLVENRGHKFKILNIFYKEKLAYTINVRDGFEEADLNKMQNAIRA